MVNQVKAHPTLWQLYNKSRKASRDILEGVNKIRSNVQVRFLDPPSEEMTKLVRSKVVYEGKHESTPHYPSTLTISDIPFSTASRC